MRGAAPIARLDGLAWGCAFSVEGPGSALDDLRAQMFPTGPPPPDPPTPGSAPTRSWHVEGRAPDAAGPGHEPTPPGMAGTDGIVRHLAAELELWVAEHAPHHLFVHAGVVVLDGQAVLIPGRSRSGKSTLVSALVRAGADYYSDEYAPIDAEGLVHPYPRSPRQRAASPAAGWPVPPPPPIEAPPVPIGLVAELRFHPAATGADLHVTSGAQGVLGLLRNTVGARRRRGEVLDVLPRAIASARCLSGDRAEAHECAQALLSQLRSPGPPAS